MAKFTSGPAFVADEQLTHSKLNNLVNAAEFASDAVDDSTTELSSGAIIVKTGGVAASQLGTNAVETLKINNQAVTTAKLDNDAVNGDKLADNAVDSEHYTDGSIRASHINVAVITGQTELTTVPHLTQDTILLNDDGALKSLKLMTYLPLPRAWGVIPWDAFATVTIAGSSGVTTSTTVSSTGDVDTATVTLSNDMSDTNYVVQATLGGSSGSIPNSDRNAVVWDRAAGSFKIGAALGTDRVIHFVVFGTLD